MKRRLLSLSLAILLLATLALPAGAVTPSYTPSAAYQSTPWFQNLLAVQMGLNPAKDMLQVCLSQLGYQEGKTSENYGMDPDGNGNYTEYGHWYQVNGVAWCAMFLSWCAEQAGLGHMIKKSAFASPHDFGCAEMNPASYSPKAGDLMFFCSDDPYEWAHIAIVLHVQDGYVYTVEGNKTNKVRTRRLPLDHKYIRCYGVWTEETATLEELGIGSIYAFDFDTNGGQGEMAGVCTIDSTPVQFFQNRIMHDRDGDDVLTTWTHKDGCTFGGWYLQRQSDNAWLTDEGFVSAEDLAEKGLERSILPDAASFPVPEDWVTHPMEAFTCYAVWYDQAGGSADGSAYVPIPDSEGWMNPYNDVNQSHWFYEAVRSVSRDGLMAGGGTKFNPNASATRGMLITILHRMEGCPVPQGGLSFSDVGYGDYCYDAVSWGSAVGIVTGRSDGSFGANDPVTREQAAAMLHRYCQYKGMTLTSDPGTLYRFADAASVSAYAVEPMSWAVGQGLINGVTPTTLNPKGTATRAQVATILSQLQAIIALQTDQSETAQPGGDER